ncbi:MAG TPA: Ig-like domain-containing protein, partial [Gemmatimonadales bacterium]|nr:Ig-like domain-containing protein [Gemmatimonadales bacterium]
MRRVLGFALLGLGWGGALAAQTVTARVGGELTGQHLSTVLVPIAVDMAGSGGAKLGSYTARLTWNPGALTFYGANAGNFPPPQINTDSTGSGVLKFTSVSPTGTGGLVTVAQMLFYVADTVGTPVTLSFNEMSAAGTFTNLLPELTVTSAMFCPSRGFWGDIDRDGASNSRDALLILSKVVGLPVDTTFDTVSTAPLIVDTTLFDSGLGDVNSDGNVTSVDALIILSTAVGIPIPGQRVMLLAPGGCGTGSALTLAVFPNTAQLAIDQAYQLLAQGRDSAGRTVTLSNATWRSSNLNVAGVDADGTVHGRAPGSAVITAAVGPGVTATATVTVAPRTKWFVNVAVTGAPVQFGTAAFPF